MEIRGFTVKYSKNKSREQKSTETNLQNRINDLFKRAEAEQNNKHIICEIQCIRLRLKKIMQYKTKGAVMRNKVRWYEDGEHCTRYFYNLEKRNYENKTTAKINAQTVLSQMINLRFCKGKWNIIKLFTLRLHTP